MSKNKKNRPPSIPAEASPTLPTAANLLGWASIAWCVWVLYRYQQQFPWVFAVPPLPMLSNAPTQFSVFGSDGRAIFLAWTSVAGMTALGSYCLRLLRLPWHSRLEEIVFSMGVGMAATGYIILALGTVQAYRPAVFWGLWSVGLALAWYRWFRTGPITALNKAALISQEWAAEQRGWTLHRLLLGFILLVALAMTCVPELFYDAMVYHLGVSRWFLHEGGIGYYPAIHAQFPFLRQMLNVFALALEGERLAKLLHAASAPLLVATYYVLSKRYSFPRTALIAPLAFFTMPMVNMNLWTTGVDIGLAALALLAFLAWINGLTDLENRQRWFVLTGLLGGCCFATKYPGLLIIAGFCVTTLFWLGCVEKNWLGGLRASVLMGVLAVLVMAPWLIKNWILTGNPVYPYLFKVFGGRDLLADRLLDFTSDTGTGAKHSLLPLLKTPWTATFDDISSFSAPGIFLLGFLGFMVTGLFRKEVRQPWYVLSCLFFALYWFVINMMTDRMRLGIPGIAIGCFLLAHTAGFLYARGDGTFRFALAALVVISAVAGGLSTLPTIYNAYAPWDVLAGRESAESYLSYTHRGLDPYPATQLFKYAKQVVPPGKRLLIVGDEKTSPCPVPFLATGVHNDSLIVQWARASKTPEDLAEHFKRNRVSHLALNVAEAVRLSPYRILNWDTESLAVYRAFSDKYLRMVHSGQIVERLANQTSPLLLYEFFETPPATPPSQNVLYEIYEMDRKRHAS